MGLLARVILPIINSLLNQKGGSVDDNLGVKFKGPETLQRCRGIGGCIKFLKLFLTIVVANIVCCYLK